MQDLLTEFDAAVTDVVHADGGRLVKFIGDAVMWVSSSPERLVRAAVDLVDHPGARAAELQVRAGLAYGTVLALNGDYFGNPVNLAARLVAAAAPGQILAAAQLRDMLPDWPALAHGPLTLKGFDAPVMAFELHDNPRARMLTRQAPPPVIRVVARDHRTGLPIPSVAVATSMPKRGVGAAVLIVPVVSTGEEDRPGAVVASAEPFLRADTVAEIEAGLRALDATGASDQVHRLAVPSLPVGSVLTVGLGKPRREWPADTIRCAAGVAARALNSSEAVITTLAELPGDGICSATVEGLILGSYRFSAFRSDKTAPKDAGLRKITVLCCAKDAKKRALHGAAVATAVATARDLVNTPQATCFPPSSLSAQRL